MLALFLLVKDSGTNKDLALGEYMHKHRDTDVSQLILKEGDSADVKKVKGSAHILTFLILCVNHHECSIIGSASGRILPLLGKFFKYTN